MPLFCINRCFCNWLAYYFMLRWLLSTSYFPTTLSVFWLRPLCFRAVSLSKYMQYHFILIVFNLNWPLDTQDFIQPLLIDLVLQNKILLAQRAAYLCNIYRSHQRQIFLVSLVKKLIICIVLFSTFKYIFKYIYVFLKSGDIGFVFNWFDGFNLWKNYSSWVEG